MASGFFPSLEELEETFVVCPDLALESASECMSDGTVLTIAHILFECNQMASMIDQCGRCRVTEIRAGGRSTWWRFKRTLVDNDVFERFERVCGMIVGWMFWGRI